MCCLVKPNFTRSLAVFKKIPNKTIFFLTISYKFSDLDNLIDVLMVYELVFHIHDLCGLHGHFTYEGSFEGRFRQLEMGSTLKAELSN